MLIEASITFCCQLNIASLTHSLRDWDHVDRDKSQIFHKVHTNDSSHHLCQEDITLPSVSITKIVSQTLLWRA